MDKTSMPNEPVLTLRDGRLKGVLWSNENRDGDQYYSVTLAKTYEDQNGKLRDTNSFSESELLRVSELAREMRGKMLDLRRDRSTEKSPERDTSKEQRPRNARPKRFEGR
ncbi:hypothetical protein ACG74X_10150 [Marivita sp. S0852]|uniref:hypothetical protein n=1 Tax=Marivita sp. S0852 TaxID=3373893 RepID=UPI003982CE59